MNVLALEAGLDAWECLKEGLTGSEKMEETGGISHQGDCYLSLCLLQSPDASLQQRLRPLEPW